jgi:thiol-disulfide isomerase/thioredoxin
MFALQSLIVLSTLAAGGDATLLQFTSQSCQACKTVEPVVQRLTAEGYNVQTIDVGQQPELAQQFQVRAVPTFVVMNGGQMAGRLEGASTYDRLVQLAQTGGLAPKTVQATDFRTGPQGSVAPPSGVAAAAPAQSLAPATTGNLSPMQRAMYATVRLKVEDQGGFGYGTGTIIDRHDEEALVVTCGHIFRQSQGKGKISVDLFGPGAKGAVEGQLITYDLDRDIALVSIRPGIAITPVAVGGLNYGVKPHDPAFSIGCDKGADASVRETKITSVNKYTGAPRFCAAGQPVDGRSGGGLFSAEGVLIGVCNAADPQDDEGLYAALASIQWQLDQIGQSDIYRRGTTAVASAAPEAAIRNGLNTPEANAVPQLSERMPSRMSEPPVRPSAPPANTFTAGPSAGPPATQLAHNVAADDVELIMIVRSKSNPQKQSQIMVLDNASPQLLQQLSAGARPAGLAAGDIRQAANNMVDAGRAALGGPLAGAVIRGQGE